MPRAIGMRIFARCIRPKGEAARPDSGRANHFNFGLEVQIFDV